MRPKFAHVIHITTGSSPSCQADAGESSELLLPLRVCSGCLERLSAETKRLSKAFVRATLSCNRNRWFNCEIQPDTRVSGDQRCSKLR